MEIFYCQKILLIVVKDFRMKDDFCNNLKLFYVLQHIFNSNTAKIFKKNPPSHTLNDEKCSP